MRKIVPLLLVVLMGCIALVGQHSARAAKPTDMVPFSLPSAVDGSVVNSDEFQGRVLLVTFFSTLCRPCVREIPTLISLQDEFSEQGFSVLALSLDRGGPEVVKRLINDKGVNYPVLMSDREVAKAFGVGSIPVSFLIDRNGLVVKKYLGLLPPSVFEREIKKLL